MYTGIFEGPKGSVTGAEKRDVFKPKPNYLDEGVDEGNLSNIIALMDDYDKKMLSYLIEIHNASGRDVINIDKFENIIQALQHVNAENEYDYLNSLLHPEKMKGVKIPSPIPVPSCAFQLHNTITLSTNSSGNLAVLFNPFFLYNSVVHGVEATANVSSDAVVERQFKCDYISSFLYNNDDSLDGKTRSGVWTAANLGQGIPGVYNQYRLVSASLVVRYIGRMDITSGVIGGAIIYDDSIIPAIHWTNTVGNTSACHPTMSAYKYSSFDTAMDSFYYQERNCIQGLRELYFPLDNTYEEYQRMIGDFAGMNNRKHYDEDGKFVYEIKTLDVNSVKSGFQQMIYVLGAPPSSSCFKFDIYCNFETLPNATFLNYMPISLSPKTISSEIKKDSIAIVQKQPITDLSTEGNWYGDVKRGIFSGLKKIWKSGLPKKVLMGIAPYVLPYFKPAVSLFNMFESSTMGNVNNSFMSKNNTVRKMINNAEKDDGQGTLMLLDK